jgi:hypothetical protein
MYAYIHIHICIYIYAYIYNYIYIYIRYPYYVYLVLHNMANSMGNLSIPPSIGAGGSSHHLVTGQGQGHSVDLEKNTLGKYMVHMVCICMYHLLDF